MRKVSLPLSTDELQGIGYPLRSSAIKDCDHCWEGISPEVRVYITGFGVS